MLSRRALISHGATAIALASASVPGLRRLVARASRVRRNANAMGPDDPDLMALREFVEVMRARPATHPAGWRAFAALHGEGTEFGICQHQNWFFLPWHRAYLEMYERAVAELTYQHAFALPYWDWTTLRTFPPAFTAPTYRGRPNALYAPGVGDAGQGTRTPGLRLPDTAVGPATMQRVMSEADFELFASSRPVDTTVTPPRPQDSIDRKWLDRTGTFGALEQVPHNQVHRLSGGFMATPASARDPLFQVHHCNVDRLWVHWNARGHANPSERIWLDMPFPDHFISPGGRRYTRRVRDLLSTTALGYVYDDAPRAVRPAPDPARSTRVQALLAGAADASGLRRMQVANVPAGRAGAPLMVEVPLQDDPLLAQGGQLPSGSIIAVIRAVHSDPGVQGMRVFVNLDTAADSVPDSDPHFVASIAFLGGTHRHAGHHRGPPSFAVDLTPALRALSGRGLLHSDRLTLQLVPLFAPTADAGHEGGTILPASVDIGVL